MKPEHSEEWYSKSWRPAAAFVYLAICVIDFSLMPLYLEWLNRTNTLSHLVDLSLRYGEPLNAFKIIQESQVWKPLTLAYNGLFHAAFGAVLGVSAWQRGKEKVAQIAANTTMANEPNKDVNAKNS